MPASVGAGARGAAGSLKAPSAMAAFQMLCIASALGVLVQAQQGTVPPGPSARVAKTDAGLAAAGAAAAAAVAPPTVIHLVADDLGYHDTNWRNHQVSTDNLDALVKVGVEIKVRLLQHDALANRSNRHREPP